MQMACACASASIAWSSVIACSLSSICLVIACANAGPEARRSARACAWTRTESPSATTWFTRPMRSASSASNRVAEEEQLARLRQADDARQQVPRAHVGAAEADLREDEAELRALARDAKVARERDDRAGADRDAVDRGDDWLAERADVADEGAGHAREGEEPARVAREELADDVARRRRPSRRPAPAPVSTTARTSSWCSSAAEEIAELARRTRTSAS